VFEFEHLYCSSWVPVYSDSSKKLAVMSIAFMLQNKDDAVVWRGPKKNGRLIILAAVSTHR